MTNLLPNGGYNTDAVNAIEEDVHHNGCASHRHRPCNCEYLGQWK